MQSSTSIDSGRASLPVKKVYWDACVFIDLINGVEGKRAVLEGIWGERDRGETLVYTSFLTYAEVFRVKCEKGLIKPYPEDPGRDDA